jgi:hypothetical protein
VLDKQIELLTVFFTDETLGYSANTAIIRRVVTSLNYGQYDYGTVVMRKHCKALGVVFIKDNGISVLGIEDKVRLVDLYE